MLINFCLWCWKICRKNKNSQKHLKISTTNSKLFYIFYIFKKIEIFQIFKIFGIFIFSICLIFFRFSKNIFKISKFAIYFIFFNIFVIFQDFWIFSFHITNKPVSHLSLLQGHINMLIAIFIHTLYYSCFIYFVIKQYCLYCTEINNIRLYGLRSVFFKCKYQQHFKKIIIHFCNLKIWITKNTNTQK